MSIAVQKHDGQLKPTYSSFVKMWGVALGTNRKPWTIGRGGKRGSGISMLMVRQDDDDDDIYIYIYMGKHLDCSLSVKAGFVQLPFYCFCGNWLLKRVIKLCCNFQSCILVILPNNLHKSLTVSIWQLSLSSEFCFSEEVFPSFSNAVITFERVLLATPNNSAVFVTLVPVIWAPTIRPLLKSDRTAILMNFYLFLLIISVKNNFFSKIRQEKLINQKP